MKLVLKTKADYVRAHHKLWGLIANVLQYKTGINPEDFDSGFELKQHCFQHLWGHCYITDSCFGCEYAFRKSTTGSICSDCLFDCMTNSNCLNGMWLQFCIHFKERNFNEASEIAIKIKKFPVRKRTRLKEEVS